MTGKTPRLDKFLYRLDDIEREARKQYGDHTPFYFRYVIKHFLEYWRQLQEEEPKELNNPMIWQRLELMFDIKLREIAYSRLEMQWLVFEYDEHQLHYEHHDEYWSLKK
ncbi:hypothetical protein ACMXYX_15825 [Neptuniibacter sp. QD72_48]|uniref:hypothetical protein n=1 Tax=Neptuniibacter sp. QD72_48 TaxID=3398214 RepID=UPI0039F5EAE3